MKEIIVKQSNGMYSHEGYSEIPMERMTYDPELDFETRQPTAQELVQKDANDKLRKYHE